MLQHMNTKLRESTSRRSISIESPRTMATPSMRMEIDTPTSVHTVEDENSLELNSPLPQPAVESTVLKDVVAYVEVRSNSENRSKAVAWQLELLGAKVVSKFTDDVTHVVWKDGKTITRTKAVKKGIHLVSVLWIDSCRKTQEHVEESLYPIIVENDTPVFPGIRKRRMKSMQPHTTEDLEKMEARYERKWKKKLAAFNAEIAGSPGTPTFNPETYSPIIVDGHILTPGRVTVPQTPPNMRKKLKQLRENQMNTSPEKPVVGESPVSSGTSFIGPKRMFSFTSSDSSDEESLPELLYETLSKKVNSLQKADRVKKSKLGRKSLKSNLSDKPMPLVFEEHKTAEGKENSESYTGGNNTNNSNGNSMKCGKEDARESHPSDVRDQKEMVVTPGIVAGVSRLTINQETLTNRNAKHNMREEFMQIKNVSGDVCDISSHKRKPVNNGCMKACVTNKLLNNPSQVEGVVAGKCSRRKSLSSKRGSRDANFEEISSPSVSYGGLNQPRFGQKMDSERKCIGRRTSQNLTTVSVEESASLMSDTTETNIIATTPVKRRKSVGRRVSQNLTSDSVESGSKMTETSIHETTPVRRKSRRSMVLSRANTSNDSGGLTDDSVISTPVSCRGDKPINVVLRNVSHVKRRKSVSFKVSPPKENGDMFDASTTRDNTPQRGGRDDTPQRGGRDDTPQRGGRDDTPQRGGRDDTPQRGGRDDTPQRGGSKRRRYSESVLGSTSALMDNKTVESKILSNVSRKKRKLLPVNMPRVLPENLIEPQENKRQQNKDTKTRNEPQNLVEPIPSFEIQKRRKSGTLKREISNAVLSVKKKKAEEMDLMNGRNENSDQVQTESSAYDSMDCSSSQSSVILEIQRSRKSIEEFRPSTGKKKKRQLYSKNETRDSESESEVETKKRKRSVRENKQEKVCFLLQCKASVVMTSIPKSDQDLVLSVVKKLKGFQIEDSVIDNTTHVICGCNRRTLNVLTAIARGCWLVSMEWVLKSLEAGHWVEEEPYELHDYFPAAQMCRLEKQAVCGKEGYRQDIFACIGLMYVAESTVPPQDKLTELIALCGGKLCNSLRTAKLCIGKTRSKGEQPMVTEKWVLDCISQHTTLPFAEYYLQ
ncbi:uncharacterized protein LOC144445799 [Glandiceps talaboti]